MTMHVRNNAAQAQSPLPAPPDTAEGFAAMSYQERVELRSRDAGLYQQLAAQEQATDGQATR